MHLMASPCRNYTMRRKLVYTEVQNLLHFSVCFVLLCDVYWCLQWLSVLLINLNTYLYFNFENCRFNIVYIRWNNEKYQWRSAMLYFDSVKASWTQCGSLDYGKTHSNSGLYLIFLRFTFCLSYMQCSWFPECAFEHTFYIVFLEHVV